MKTKRTKLVRLLHAMVCRTNLNDLRELLDCMEEGWREQANGTLNGQIRNHERTVASVARAVEQMTDHDIDIILSHN